MGPRLSRRIKSSWVQRDNQNHVLGDRQSGRKQAQGVGVLSRQEMPASTGAAELSCFGGVGPGQEMEKRG